MAEDKKKEDIVQEEQNKPQQQAQAAQPALQPTMSATPQTATAPSITTTNPGAGYKSDTVRSGSNTVSSSAQQSEQTSAGQSSTNSEQKRVFNGTPEEWEKVNGLLEDLKKGGSYADAFKKHYSEPSPEEKERAAKTADKRRKAANITESLRLIMDMGGAFAGGKVHERKGVGDIIDKADKLENDAKQKYDEAVKDFNNKYLDAKNKDLADRQKLFDQYITNMYGTQTTSDTNTSSNTKGASQSQGSQSTQGVKEVNLADKEWDEQQRMRFAAWSKAQDEDMITPIGKKYIRDSETGQVRLESVEFPPMTKKHFEGSVAPVMREDLLNNKAVHGKILDKYGIRVTPLSNKPEDIAAAEEENMQNLRDLLNGNKVTIKRGEDGNSKTIQIDPNDAILNYWEYSPFGRSLMAGERTQTKASNGDTSYVDAYGNYDARTGEGLNYPPPTQGGSGAQQAGTQQGAAVETYNNGQDVIPDNMPVFRADSAGVHAIPTAEVPTNEKGEKVHTTGKTIR